MFGFFVSFLLNKQYLIDKFKNIQAIFISSKRYKFFAFVMKFETFGIITESQGKQIQNLIRVLNNLFEVKKS